jgi:hypothetical protein
MRCYNIHPRDPILFFFGGEGSKVGVGFFGFLFVLNVNYNILSHIVKVAKGKHEEVHSLAISLGQK